MNINKEDKMSYKPFSLLCSNRSHGEMDYIGEGDYECRICGESYHDCDYDDDGSDECLSVYDAADIWESYGRDEDYMFGYTEEELEAAL